MTSDDACRSLKGALAMRALGRSDRDDLALDEHLAMCASCRAELVDLRTVAAALVHAGGLTVGDDVGPPEDLPVRIVEAVHAQSTVPPGRRRGVLLAVAAAVLVVAIGVVALVATGDDEPVTAITVELDGQPGVTGWAELHDQRWGTEVVLHTEGLDAERVYWLWVTGSDGDRVTAGTFVGTGNTMQAVLAAAVPTSDARRIWLTDADDNVILDAMIEPR